MQKAIWQARCCASILDEYGIHLGRPGWLPTGGHCHGEDCTLIVACIKRQLVKPTSECLRQSQCPGSGRCQEASGACEPAVKGRHGGRCVAALPQPSAAFGEHAGSLLRSRKPASIMDTMERGDWSGCLNPTGPPTAVGKNAEGWPGKATALSIRHSFWLSRVERLRL